MVVNNVKGDTKFKMEFVCLLMPTVKHFPPMVARSVILVITTNNLNVLKIIDIA